MKRVLQSLLAILVLAFSSTPSRAALPHSQSPYELRWDLDLGLSLVAVPGWLLTSMIVGQQQTTPHCGMDATVCDRANLNPVDNYFLNYNPGWPRPYSDVVFTYVPPAYLVLSFLDYRLDGWKAWLTDSTVIIEAWAWSGFVNQIFRAALHRPRPYLYIQGAYQNERDTTEATTGYYSGHASEAFAFAVAAGYTFTLRHGNSPWTYVVWGVMGGLAISSSLARVVSGDHFASDVFVASLAGTGFGLIIPAIHRKRWIDPAHPLAQLRIMPVGSDGYYGVSVGGRF